MKTIEKYSEAIKAVNGGTLGEPVTLPYFPDFPPFKPIAPMDPIFPFEPTKLQIILRDVNAALSDEKLPNENNV